MPFIVMTRRAEMISFIKEKKRSGLKIGFVPTMGALHKGHETLFQQSVGENDLCVASVFVNPKQFSANEDLSKYPRQFEKDCAICEANGVQVLFAPTVGEMYPPSFSTEISLPGFSQVLCGQVRPGHFTGVATVVMLLLNIVQPETIYLGQKDFQQVQIIKQMCTDLGWSGKVVMVPTVREQDGLALSSRNVYLTTQAREIAKTIPKSLASVAKLYLAGERSAEKLMVCAQEIFSANSLTPQYLEIRSTANLTKLIEDKIEEDCVLAVAQIIHNQEATTDQVAAKNLAPGVVRLIDNIILSEDSHWVKALETLVASCSST